MAIGAIMIRGFTTGIDDEDIPEEAKKQITDVLKTAIEKVEDLVESYKRGELEQMPGRSLEETLEVEAMKILGRARDQAGQIAGKHLGIENSAVIMARSGAREIGRASCRERVEISVGGGASKRKEGK